jgi:hypothetical protein
MLVHWIGVLWVPTPSTVRNPRNEVGTNAFLCHEECLTINPTPLTPSWSAAPPKAPPMYRTHPQPNRCRWQPLVWPPAGDPLRPSDATTDGSLWWAPQPHFAWNRIPVPPSCSRWCPPFPSPSATTRVGGAPPPSAGTMPNLFHRRATSPWAADPVIGLI